MLSKTTSETSDSSVSRAERRQQLLARLQQAAAPLPEQLADTLAGAPDRELFRSVEVQARDLGQRLAAAAQQAGLDDRKKGGTQAPARSAPTARATPASSNTAPPTDSSTRSAPWPSVASDTKARRLPLR